MYRSNILSDVIGPHKVRLTTFEVTFPRPYLAEFNTHRVFSRNSASSRAIPTELQIAMVRDTPYIPEFRERVKGMGGGVPLTGARKSAAQNAWYQASRDAIKAAEKLLRVAKDDANRLLEPFAWQTCIVSATEWRNFFALRDDEYAALPMQKIAAMMRRQYALHVPERVNWGEWSLPLVTQEDRRDLYMYVDGLWAAKASAGRCARVSYNKHAEEDTMASSVERWDRLASNKHWSPSEHPARCVTESEWDRIIMLQDELLAYGRWRRREVNIDPLEFIGNFRGFVQLRKHYEGESGE